MEIMQIHMNLQWMIKIIVLARTRESAHTDSMREEAEALAALIKASPSNTETFFDLGLS